MNIALPVSTFATHICMYIKKGPINVALVCGYVGYIYLYVRPLHANNLLEVRAAWGLKSDGTILFRKFLILWKITRKDPRVDRLEILRRICH